MLVRESASLDVQKTLDARQGRAGPAGEVSGPAHGFDHAGPIKLVGRKQGSLSFDKEIDHASGCVAPECVQQGHVAPPVLGDQILGVLVDHQPINGQIVLRGTSQDVQRGHAQAVPSIARFGHSVAQPRQSPHLARNDRPPQLLQRVVGPVVTHLVNREPIEPIPERPVRPPRGVALDARKRLPRNLAQHEQRRIRGGGGGGGGVVSRRAAAPRPDRDVQAGVVLPGAAQGPDRDVSGVGARVAATVLLVSRGRTTAVGVDVARHGIGIRVLIVDGYDE
mmetsp:Transcript_50201/g.106909  ORF Transcript_50201/g.106909 Transcript_50201/m.106909 type:complete len:279 (-) Transcript_50201:26-862(-)